MACFQLKQLIEKKPLWKLENRKECFVRVCISITDYGWKDTKIRADERLLPMALIRRKFK